MKMIGLARLGRDAGEPKYTGKGDAVVNLSLAYEYGRKGEDGKRPTQWIDATLFGKRAEVLAQYLTKGSLILAELEGVHVETYKDREGNERTKLAAVVVDVGLTGRAEQRDEPARSAAPRPAPSKPAAKSTAFDGMDNDLPPF